MDHKTYNTGHLELVLIPTPDRAIVGGLHFFTRTPRRGAVIFIPGLHGPIISAHDYRPLAEAATKIGFDLLLVQMRSALDWGNATFEDCAIDIQAAIDYLKADGVTDIALFGTSLGSARVMYYHSLGADPSVRVTGFLAGIASPYLELKIKAPERLPVLDTVLAKARALVAKGESEEPVRYDWLPGRPQIQSSRSFISFFGAPDESNCSTVKFGHCVKVPALVLHGTADEVAVPENATAIYDSLINAPSRELQWLEGAVHYMAQGWIAEEFGRMMAEWTDRMMPKAEQ